MCSKEVNITSSLPATSVHKISSCFQTFSKDTSPRLLRSDMEQSWNPLQKAWSDPQVESRLLQELLILVGDSATRSKSHWTKIASQCSLNWKYFSLFPAFHLGDSNRHQERNPVPLFSRKAGDEGSHSCNMVGMELFTELLHILFDGGQITVPRGTEELRKVLQPYPAA